MLVAAATNVIAVVAVAFRSERFEAALARFSVCSFFPLDLYTSLPMTTTFEQHY